MGSKLVLKNDIESEFSIEHKNGKTKKILNTSDFKYIRNTVDDMQNIINPTDNDVCFVIDLDRGGSFIYDSSKINEDNQGTNFKGWIRQYIGVVNVKWFGITTNITNNTTIVQTLIDSFDYIDLSGTYEIGTIFVNSKSNKKIIGSGKIYSKNDIVFSFIECSNIIIDELNIDQSISETPDVAPSIYSRGTILLKSCDNIIVKNCNIYTAFSAGVSLINTSNSIIDGNNITESLNTISLTNNSLSSHGVYIVDNSNNNKIINNTIANQGYGVSLQNIAQDAKLNKNIIKGNTINKCFVYGIMLYNQNLHTGMELAENEISNNIIDTVYGQVINGGTGNKDFGAGIYLLNNEHTNVTNNTIINTNVNTEGLTLNPASIGLSSCRDISVTNNVIRDYNIRAINVYNKDAEKKGISIVGNTISNVKSLTAINVNASGVTITGNNFSCTQTPPNYGWCVQGLEKYTGVTYQGLIFSDNTIHSMNIINLKRHENFNINNNYCDTTTNGIKIEDLSYGIISNNTIIDTTVTALIVSAPNVLNSQATICIGNNMAINIAGYIHLGTPCLLDMHQNIVVWFRITGTYAPLVVVGATNSVNATTTKIFKFDNTNTTPDIDTIIMDDTFFKNDYKEIKFCTQTQGRTIKNTGTGVGGISLSGGTDADMPAQATLILEFNPSGSYWKELSRNF